MAIARKEKHRHFKSSSKNKKSCFLTLKPLDLYQLPVIGDIFCKMGTNICNCDYLTIPDGAYFCTTLSGKESEDRRSRTSPVPPGNRWTSPPLRKRHSTK